MSWRVIAAIMVAVFAIVAIMTKWLVTQFLAI